MSRSNAYARLCVLSALGACLVLTSPASSRAADWPVISTVEMSLTKPSIDPNADAEVLLWDVRVTDSDALDELATILHHHVRIKIFTDRGREAHSKVDLTYSDDARVRDIEGRTVLPTGTVTELRGQDVFDRTVIEANGFSLKAKSFVLPAAGPGSIIEYRWREIRDNSLADGVELPFYREIPVHVVRYHIKPLPVRDLGYQMRTQQFNLREQLVLKKEDGGYAGVELTNVAGVRREPYMPPSLSLGPWMLLYYADLATADRTPDRFWNEFGKDLYGVYKQQLRITSAIRTTAADVTKAATSVDEKVDALVAFVRAKVKRDDVAGVGARKRKENKNSADTLARGVGDGIDQTILFVALASAAGLDARFAMLPDRSDFLSQPGMKQPYFLRHMAAAVRSGESWRFVDPANRHAKGGHLAWRYEGLYALLLDDKTSVFVPVPIGEPALTTRKRTAAFTLLEDGTLEGDVTLEYTGHVGSSRRDSAEDESAAEIERAFVEDFVKRLPGAEISGFSVANLDNPEAPYTIRFKLRAPGYGQRVGSRLFLQPAVIQRGAEAMFSASTRQYHVYFPYAWSEQDAVTFDVPEGYEVETDEGPTPSALNGGAAAAYLPKVIYTPDTRRVTYSRALAFGYKGNLLYQPGDYQVIKSFFGAVDKADGYTVALRRRSAGDAK